MTETARRGSGRAWNGYARGRARHQDIIRTATSQFAQKGFESATILDLAEACNISRAGLLHYFPDKQSLLQAVLEDRDVEEKKRFGPYAQIPGGVGVLRGIVDLAERNQAEAGLVALFSRLSAEAADPAHPAHGYFIERFERIRRGTQGALRASSSAGYLREDVDPADAAVRLTALMDGLQTQWLIDKRVNITAHIRNAVLQLLNEAGKVAFDAVQISQSSHNSNS